MMSVKINGPKTVKTMLGVALILMTALSVPALAQDDASLMPPDNFTARAVPAEKVILNWAKVKGDTIVGYNVYRAKVGGKDFVKVNSELIPATTYEDRTVKDGGSYDYVVKAVNVGGRESEASARAGAPNMIMVEKAVIVHQGKVVKTAIPGDVIMFTVSYRNNGYGEAREAAIVHAVPKGTTFVAGSEKLTDSGTVTTHYWSKNAKEWLENAPADEADIGKVRWVFAEPILPTAEDPNGHVSFKVVINE
jgi:uncharacterized repeat protein (TIGR01451 family)